MADLVVVVPSRGRPQQAGELLDAFGRTCTAGTRVMLAVDSDDPALPDYRTVAYPRAALLQGAHQSMVHALNQAAAAVTEIPETPFAVGFMGDDHRPRTIGWDRAYLDALAELGTGIVYGNDLLQGERIPTQCAMTADIIRTLGWMAPPVLTHLYVDDYWATLGRSLGRLLYLPDVVVEHCHPFAGTGRWDAGYQRVNAQAMYDRDRAAYETYATGHLADDVAKVQALLGLAAR